MIRPPYLFLPSLCFIHHTAYPCRVQIQRICVHRNHTVPAYFSTKGGDSMNHTWRRDASSSEEVDTVYETKDNRISRRHEASNFVKRKRSARVTDENIDPFLEKVEASWRRDILLPFVSQTSSSPPSSSHPIIFVLLAVSGGADSMALFHSMRHLSSSPSSSLSNGTFVAPLDSSSSSQHGDSFMSHKIQLHVVHFDHCQRGEQSTLDRKLVEETCKNYQIPFYYFIWDQETTLSSASFSQDVARKWRQDQARKLLVQLIQREQANRKMSNNLLSSIAQQQIEPSSISGIICTAHHKDDQEESILLKLLRGVHLSNISGMKPLTFVSTSSSSVIQDERNDILQEETDEQGISPSQQQQQQQPHHITTEMEDEPDGEGAVLPRIPTAIPAVHNRSDNNNTKSLIIAMAKPMLSIRKSEILQFLTSHGLVWREDESNASNKYLRNRVRNELVPLLQDLMGSRDILERRLDFMQEQSMKMEQALDKQAFEYFSSFHTRFNHTTSSTSSSSSFSSSDIPLEFPLKSKYTTTWSAGEEHALYLWLRHASKNRLFVPYDKLVGICHQVSHYPQRTRWTLEMGSGWNVIRKGKTLLLKYLPSSVMTRIA